MTTTTSREEFQSYVYWSRDLRWCAAAPLKQPYIQMETSLTTGRWSENIVASKSE